MKTGNGFLSVRGALALASVFVCVFWAIAQYSDSERKPVSGPADLRREFRRAQKLAPPSGSRVVCDAGVFSCVPGTGPVEREFAAALVARLQPDGGTLWPVTVCEDAASGDTVFLDADGTVVCRLAPEPGAVPALTEGRIFPRPRLPAVAVRGHDPSRVVMTARLSASAVQTRAWAGDSVPAERGGHPRQSAPAGFKDYLVVWNSSSNIWLGGESGAAAGVSMIDAGYSHGIALHDDGSVTRIGVDPDTDGITEQRFPSAGAMLVSAGGLGDTAVLGFDGALRHVSGAGELLGIAEGTGQVKAVAAGDGHLLALLNNGVLLSLGAEGALVPPEGLSGVAEIGAGPGFSVARRHNGSVVAWGDAVAATNLASGVSSVSASRRGNHCLALMRDGTVTAWGGDSASQCRIPAGLSGVSAVAAGGYHSLALKRDGTVACWGLIKGAPPLLTNVVAIGASYLDACAVTEDGTVAIWGRGCPLGGVRLKARTPGACEILDARIVDCGVYMAVVRARAGLLEGDADGDGVPALEEVFLHGTDPLLKDAGVYALSPAADPQPKGSPARRKSGLRASGMSAALYSMSGGTTYYADAARSDNSGDGLSWETAKQTIQAAVDIAQAGDSVLVAPGTYDTGTRITPDGQFNNRLVIGNGVMVSSAGGAGATVILGSGSDYFDTCDAVRCVYITDGVLDGFTLQGGAAVAHWTSPDPRDKSGGCLNMGCATAESEARNCIIAGGTAYDGGGVSGGRLVNCVIRDCNAYYPAGADWSALINCTVTANGGWWWSSCGGARCSAVTNSIISGNWGWESPECHCCALYRSCSDADDFGNGNTSSDVLFADPLFADAGNGNFNLLPDSLCIDAGDGAYVTCGLDLAGNPRVQCGAVDMGALESSGWGGNAHVLTVEGGSGGGLLTPGSVACVSAEARPYYSFSGWAVSPEGADLGASFSGAEPVTSVTMPAYDVTLTAAFSPVDSDGDGLPDEYELFCSGTNPYAADSDGDHFSDGPLIPPGDETIVGVSDAFPNDAAGTVDTDGDGKPDCLTGMFSTSDPQLEEDLDDDNDSMPDWWEILHGLSPTCWEDSETMWGGLPAWLNCYYELTGFPVSDAAVLSFTVYDSANVNGRTTLTVNGYAIPLAGRGEFSLHFPVGSDISLDLSDIEWPGRMMVCSDSCIVTDADSGGYVMVGGGSTTVRIPKVTLSTGAGNVFCIHGDEQPLAASVTGDLEGDFYWFENGESIGDGRTLSPVGLTEGSLVTTFFYPCGGNGVPVVSMVWIDRCHLVYCEHGKLPGECGQCFRGSCVMCPTHAGTPKCRCPCLTVYGGGVVCWRKDMGTPFRLGDSNDTCGHGGTGLSGRCCSCASHGKSEKLTVFGEKLYEVKEISQAISVWLSDTQPPLPANPDMEVKVGDVFGLDNGIVLHAWGEVPSEHFRDAVCKFSQVDYPVQTAEVKFTVFHIGIEPSGAVQTPAFTGSTGCYYFPATNLCSIPVSVVTESFLQEGSVILSASDGLVFSETHGKACAQSGAIQSDSPPVSVVMYRDFFIGAVKGGQYTLGYQLREHIPGEADRVHGNEALTVCAILPQLDKGEYFASHGMATPLTVLTGSDSFDPKGYDLEIDGVQVTAAAMPPWSVDVSGLPAGQHVLTLRSKSFPVLTDDAPLIVFKVDITQIISDQIPSVEVNALPPTRDANDPMIMGNRSDNRAYLKVVASVEPVSATDLTHIGVRKLGTTTILDHHTVSSDSKTPLVFDAEALELYEIVGGIDANGNGQLEDNEIGVVVPHRVRTITNGAYEVARGELLVLTMGAWAAYPTANSLLFSFLTQFTPSQFSANNTDVCAQELTHPLGAHWNSSGTTSCRLYSNPNLTEVLFAWDFRQSILTHASQNHFQEIQDFFNTNPNAQEAWFGPWSFSFPSFAFDSNSYAVDIDLRLAFHGVTGMQGQYRLRILRDMTVAEMCVDSGHFTDTYDFNYKDGGFVQKAATVEAGYDTLGGAGCVFKLDVSFHGNMMNP